MQYKDFFDRYDALGTLHPGFLQSMDLSAYTDITFLNELTANLMDAYLYNELSDSLVLKRWKHYLVWDKAENRFEIKSAFYADFAAAVYAYLAKKQRWWELAQTNFESLSATDIKTIEHGLKETDMDYGATQETNQYGQKQRTDLHGAQSATRNYDKVVVTVEREQDSHVTGAESGSSSETVTNKVFPLGAAAYVDDTQSSSSGTTSAQARTDTDTWGDQESTTAAREDTEGTAAYTDTSTDAQHTDTKSTIAKQDKQTVKAYVDTERQTKHIIISPEKLYDINKELVEIGAYDLMLEAVRETMILGVWEVAPW